VKIIAAILSALAFNFLFLVGLKIGYLDHYAIEVYYNPFFAHNQPWSYLFFFVPALLSFYIPQKLGAIIMILLILISLSTFIAPLQIGHKLYSEEAYYKIGQYPTPKVTLLLSHRGNDYVLFDGHESAKIIKTSNRIK